MVISIISKDKLIQSYLRIEINEVGFIVKFSMYWNKIRMSHTVIPIKKRTRSNMSHIYADSFMANDLIHATI